MVEETLFLLRTGRLVVPPRADPGDWILSGGKVVCAHRDRVSAKKRQLGTICDEYLTSIVDKAESTIYGEKLHIERLKSALRCETSLNAVTRQALQRYANKRSQTKHRGKPISGTTIRKELMTFRQIWRWAKRAGRVTLPCPLFDEEGKWQIALPKPAEGKRFQTWSQIERQIAIGKLSEFEQAELWDGLYLDNDEVLELLEHVKAKARHDFIYPMFAFAAYTGCRRSELLRSQLHDIDLEDQQIRIRERKRRKNLTSSTRIVPMHDRLADVLSEWFEAHPGGASTFAPPRSMRHRNGRARQGSLTKDQAHNHFKAVLSSSKWKVVPGYHVLRHSFGANLARRGIPERTIGEWMGHTTAEMRKLYQHLFPQDGAAQIGVLL